MKIAALVSGGVDSSVALKILKDQGHDITAFYLKIWLENELSNLNSCPWKEDLSYVTAVCKQLNVPLKIVNLQKEYHNKVVSYTIAEAKAGRTPNPDILCNQFIKFGVFLDYIGTSFDKIATGHYAQILETKNSIKLRRSPDPIKDQSYFLCNLEKNQLKRIIFPIGHLIKQDVRTLAEKFDLANKNRKDSQGICFLGKFKFKDFLKRYLGEKPGELKNFETNKKIGIHQGHWFYTIGQRKNIRLSDGPWYVVKKDPKQNIVYVSNKYESISEPRKSLIVTNFNWINGRQPEKKDLLIKLRHRAIPQKCFLEFFDNKAKIILSNKDQGIASGQFAVFYDDDNCLGSAIIQ
ncbi:tRNA 2-thiouridine(34) synthase MnmA [Candidatus Babeliales bacterium]|nr:tRNA 2-thiouridine(34) synthase MnmA [Candidatus Babeliales bacterium]